MAKIVDCMRNRFMCPWHVTAECQPTRVECGPCAKTDCKQELFEAKQALIQFSQGQREVEVAEDGIRTRYYYSDEALKCLKERVRQLEAECGDKPEGSVYVNGCGPCGQTVHETFVRTRPAALTYQTSEYDY